MAARRVEGLQIERAADEILALKPGAARSHALNQTAAVIFDMCDGTHSKAEMAIAIKHHTGLPADEMVVDLALDELVDAGLVVRDGPPAGISRRALMRRLSLSAAAAALLPVIEPILLTPVATAEPLAPAWAQGKPSGVPPPKPSGQPTPPGKPSGVPPPKPSAYKA